MNREEARESEKFHLHPIGRQEMHTNSVPRDNGTVPPDYRNSSGQMYPNLHDLYE